MSSAKHPAGSVSVVIPARDAAAFLAEALASVLAQEPAPAEILVVDDGSIDGTAGIASATTGVTLLSQPPKGTPAARNAGVAATSGEWIAFLDADDLWLPGKLAAQLDAAHAKPELHGLFTHLRNIYANPEIEARYGAAAGDLPGIHASTLLIRRTALATLGGFDESARRVEFIEWYARARDAGLEFEVLESVRALRRIHGTNSSIRATDNGLEYVRFLRQRIRERRERSE